MEKIIDYLDDEEFENVKLYTYSFNFENINDNQKNEIIDLFNDWDWESGLHIAELAIYKDNNNTIFTFKSPKMFELKDDENWTDKDLEKNLLTKLVGKEQFISQFEFFETSIAELPIKFIDDQENKYKVEVSKYSSLLKE